MLDKVLKKRPTEIEAEYPLEDFEDGTGFFVTLRYVGLQELERSLEGNTRKALKGGKVKDVAGGITDGLRQAVARAIIGWRGLTKAILVHMNLDLDLEALEDLPEEIPFSDESKVTLLQNDGVFFRWVRDLVTDITEMRMAEVSDEAKNSPTSHDGTPNPGE